VTRHVWSHMRACDAERFEVQLHPSVRVAIREPSAGPGAEQQLIREPLAVLPQMLAHLVREAPTDLEMFKAIGVSPIYINLAGVRRVTHKEARDMRHPIQEPTP
jgi:hypothetical protein